MTSAPVITPPPVTPPGRPVSRAPRRAASSRNRPSRPGSRAAERAAARQSTTARVVAWSVITISGLTIWLLLYGLVFSRLSEQHSQYGLYESFRSQLAAGTAPLGGPVPEGTPVTMLDVPAAGINGLMVVEGTTSADLRLGPGLMPGTPLPGQAGASVLLGRSTSFGAPFGHIARLRPGDVIKATTGQGVFTYVVSDIRYAHDPAPRPLASGAGQLTLVTATGGGWRAGWSPTGTVFVDATLKGPAQPTPAGSLATQPADQIMSGDDAGLYPLVLWLLLLAAGLIAIVWFLARWGRYQAWLIGTPIVLVALSGSASSIWLLLPNLL
jgi:sortase A